jgi:hypothetical protein
VIPLEGGTATKIIAIDTLLLRVPTPHPIRLAFPENQLAAAHQIAFTPHVPHELSLHVLGALSNGFLAEYIAWAPSDLFEGMPRCEDGHFRIPDRPSHGISLAPEAARRYRP